MRSIAGLILIFFTNLLVAQTDSIELFRAEGHQAKLDGDFEKSIQKYSKILDLEPEDYDARLALARLYYLESNYDTALKYFELIYENDSTDVEALNGFGQCYMQKGDLPQSIKALKRAVIFLPDYVPEYLMLAKAYSYNGEMDAAIEAYESANKIDSTYSQVWAGIGQMYYWKSQPATAVKYYEKALELDPENKSIQAAFDLVRNEMKYQTQANFKTLVENEELYSIGAIIQKYTLSKRLNDRWKLEANFLLDHSNRDFENDIGDTTRWFDNTWLKVNWISGSHSLSAYAGGSGSEHKLTTYGLSWNAKTAWGGIKFANTLAAGYDYFYYWNDVGKMAIDESLKITFKRLEGQLGLSAGKIDDAPIRQYSDLPYEVGQNPYLSYRVALHYKVLSKPQIKIGGNYSLMDFKYRSPDYYTPYNRKLAGPSASIYHKGKNWYFYGSYAYNIGTENYYYLLEGDQRNYAEGTIDVDNWSAGLEIGYEFHPFSLSIGGSRFYNPFYENLTGFVTLSANF